MKPEDPRALASDPDAWVMHRLTALPPKVELQQDPTTVGPAELGVEYASAPRPQPWRFAASPKAERDPRHPDFTPYDPRSWAVPDHATLTAVLDAAAAAYDELKSSGLPDFLLASELPHWKKITAQRGTLLYWFVARQGPARGEAKPIPQDIHAAFMELADTYARFRNDDAPMPRPSATNSGWPCFQSDDLASRIVGTLLRSSSNSVPRTAEMQAQFSSLVGLPIAAAGGFGLAGRSGPSYKMRPLLRMTAAATWERIGEWVGYYQRNRVVQMGPEYAAHGTDGLYRALKGSRRVQPGLWHAGGAPRQRVLDSLAFPYSLEADISGYDVTVTPELKDLVASAWARAFPDLRDEVSMWRYVGGRPIITPSWDLNSSLLAVVRAEGGIRSGERPTGEFGTFVTKGIGNAAFRRMGIRPADAQGMWDAVASHQGDDVHIRSKLPLDPSVWAQTFEDAGLTSEVFPGVSFLARLQHPSYLDVPIAGRLVQQRCFNEHERMDLDTPALHYLGFIAATDRAERMNLRLSTLAWGVIRQLRWVRELQSTLTSLASAKTIAEARAALLDSADVRDSISAFVQSSEGEAWVDTLRREAEHSVSAAAALALIADVTPWVGARASSKDYLAMRVTNAIDAEPDDHRRVRLAVEGWHVANGPTRDRIPWIRSLITSYPI